MAGLSGCVHDGVGTHVFQKIEHTLTVSDVQFMMLISVNQASKSLLIPASVALRSEKDGSLIVVDAVDLLATGRKEGDDFRSDEAGGAGDEELHAYNLWAR